MILKNNSRLQISLLIYLVLICGIIYLRPSFLYDKQGKLKTFGTGKQSTIFPLWLIVLMMAFLSYYLSQIILYVHYVKNV